MRKWRSLLKMLHFLELRMFHMQVAACFSSLSFWIGSMVICLLRNDTTITGESISARIIECSATRIVSCLWTSSLDAKRNNMFDILDRSLLFTENRAGAECIATIFLSVDKIPSKQQIMFVGSSKMSTAKLSATWNHLQTFKVSKLTTNWMIPSTSIKSFVPAQSLGPWRRLM